MSVSEASEEVRLEGFHAVKHALRFGAEVRSVVTDDRVAVAALIASLAPDISAALEGLLRVVTVEEMRALAPRPLPSPLIAMAVKRPGDPAMMLADNDGRPLVLLEEPRHAGNLGAAVRVAAAAGIRGLLSSGDLDPWSTAALRGSAGLHYALDVAGVDRGVGDAGAVAHTGRRVIALDPEGDPLIAADLEGGPLLAFGSERVGLSPGLLKRADRRVALPMMHGVSSLNLATAVAATLFAWRLAHP